MKVKWLIIFWSMTVNYGIIIKKNPSPAELLFAKLMIILSQCSSL